MDIQTKAVLSDLAAGYRRLAAVAARGFSTADDSVALEQLSAKLALIDEAEAFDYGYLAREVSTINGRLLSTGDTPGLVERVMNLEDHVGAVSVRLANIEAAPEPQGQREDPFPGADPGSAAQASAASSAGAPSSTDGPAAATGSTASNDTASATAPANPAPPAPDPVPEAAVAAQGDGDTGATDGAAAGSAVSGDGAAAAAEGASA